MPTASLSCITGYGSSAAVHGKENEAIPMLTKRIEALHLAIAAEAFFFGLVRQMDAHLESLGLNSKKKAQAVNRLIT